MAEDSEQVRREHLVAGVEPRRVYAIVVDFAAYPRLFPEIKEARVVRSEGRVQRVEFKAQIVLPIRYVLDLTCDPEALTVDWTFVEGEVVTDSRGGWRFTAEAGGTRVAYCTSMSIRAPLPGFLVKKVTGALISASLPAMFTALEREVRARG